MADDSDLALAFTLAIVKPGGQAALIDRDNRSLGWVPLEDAVASGMAYMVEPRQGLVPLDLDSGEDWAWANRARKLLAARGCRFVVTDSGSPGHGHLWIVAPPGWSNHYTKTQVYASAGEHDQRVARLDTATRPPLSPHRSGRGRSTVVEPGLATALTLFRSTHQRDLPEKARDQLQWLHPSSLKMYRGAPSRGVTLHAVACAAVNARWTYDTFLAELRKPANKTASKYRELPPGTRDDYAENVWDRAVKYVRSNPPRLSAEVARESLESLLAGVPDLAWSARTGANDRAVYKALIHFGHKGATTEVSASVRQLGERANLSNNGVTKALSRLREQRLIERIPAQKHGFAAKYRLMPVPGTASKVFAAEDNIGLLRGARRTLLSQPTALLDDLFSNGTGFGLSCRETWEALPETPTKVSELATLRPGGLRPATLRAHLRTLRDHSFADNEGHRWWRLEPDADELERLASLLGVRGKTKARTEYNRRQVTEYRGRFGLPAPKSG